MTDDSEFNSLQIRHSEFTSLDSIVKEEIQQLFPKYGRGLKLRTTEKQMQLMVRAGLEPGTLGSRFLRAYSQATLPSQPGSLIVDLD